MRANATSWLHTQHYVYVHIGYAGKFNLLAFMKARGEEVRKQLAAIDAGNFSQLEHQVPEPPLHPTPCTLKSVISGLNLRVYVCVH